MKPLRKRYPVAVVLAVLALVWTPASSLSATETQPQVEEPKIRDYIFASNVELGVFFPKISTTVRLDSAAEGPGTEVSLEDDLGYSDSEILPLFQATWRISNNWLLQGDFVDLSRSSQRTIDTEIEWPPGEGGETFPVGANIASSFDFRTVRLAAAYIFRTGKRGELALVGGFHVTSMGVGIDAMANIGDDIGTVADDASIRGVPLPTLGLYWGTRFGDNWSVRLRGDFFYLSFDGYSGSLINARADVSYDLSRRWAVGAGLNYYDLKLEAEKNRFFGQADLNYWGPNAFVRFLF